MAKTTETPAETEVLETVEQLAGIYLTIDGVAIAGPYNTQADAEEAVRCHFPEATIVES